MSGVNTQKNEAINRSYIKNNPKAVTCSRLFSARAARTILNYNLGFANSTFAILNCFDHSLCNQVSKYIVDEEKLQSNRRRNQSSKKRKKRRHKATVNKFKNYKEAGHKKIFYKSGVELPFKN